MTTSTPDTPATGRSSPESPIDAATVLEEAADWLLINGVCRDGTYGLLGSTRCAMGAIFEVTGRTQDGAAAAQAMQVWLRHSGLPPIHRWNDTTTDDFQVIDALRHVAKDLRNTAVLS